MWLDRASWQLEPPVRHCTAGAGKWLLQTKRTENQELMVALIAQHAGGTASCHAGDGAIEH